MRFFKRLPYKMKTALPAFLIAGGAMMTASCEREEPFIKNAPITINNENNENNNNENNNNKENNDNENNKKDSLQNEQPKPICVEMDVVYGETLPFFYYVSFEEFDVKHLTDSFNYYLTQENVKRIYVVPKGDWSICGQEEIHNSRTYILEFVVTRSKKIRGKGDFNFKPGEASKVPEDSLWYIQNGWTINKALQNQK